MAERPQNKRKSSIDYHPEMHAQDVNNHEVFQNNRLASQFLRNYTGISIFQNVQEEDLEDITKRYRAFLGVEFESDTIKKVYVHSADGMVKEEIYVISLIEHKSSVDYDVAMQILRYMSVIWHDYKATREKEREGCSRQKGFRYPLIIPIVYYEGKEKWTADFQFKGRIEFAKEMGKYIPDFTYVVVSLNKYTNEELSQKRDEISLIMLINKIQTEKDLEEFRKVPEEVVEAIYGNAPKEIKDIFANIIWSLLMKLNVPNEEAEEIVEQMRGGHGMGFLFENMDKMDIQAERRNTQREKERADKAEAEIRKIKSEYQEAQKEIQRLKEKVKQIKQ